MLGLADRGRVIDLFEQVMGGDISAALAEMKEQYDIGASPSVVLTDLADFIHFVTRLKFVAEAVKDPSLSETERRRGVEFAQKLSVRSLGRAWQILLKGIAEVEGSERPLAAADMVLVRLTHAANLPAPDELVRTLTAASGGEAATPRGNGTANTGDGGSRGAAAPREMASTRSEAPRNEGPRMQSAGGAPRAELAQAKPEESVPVLELGRFEDLVLLAEDKREIRLKTLLRNNERLVNFRDGQMEFNIAGNPPANFVSELGQKLLAWTGKRWSLVVSREGGAPTLDEQEKAEQGQRTEAARIDPVVSAILSRFPGSRIVDVQVRAEAVETPEAEQAIAEAETREGLDDFFE
jgi:DNA polymerase-3 subunit gamma/tau